MNDREKLWSASYYIIEGLGPRFGMWKNTALRLAYDNIMYKLTDAEIKQVLENLKAVMNSM